MRAPGPRAWALGWGGCIRKRGCRAASTGRTTPAQARVPAPYGSGCCGRGEAALPGGPAAASHKQRR